MREGFSMNNKLKLSIEKALSNIYSDNISIEKGVSITGGCINSATLIKTSIGESFFLKYNDASPKGMFQAEAFGLNELSKSDGLKVPAVVAYSDDPKDGIPFILMEYVISGGKGKEFYEAFGRGFAKLHQTTKGQYGFSEDNFIGSTPQVNGWMDSWVSFFREKRLGYQVELAKSKGLWDSKLEKMWNSLSQKLDDIIGNPKEPASLLHGDLWSGNYIVGPKGEPCLIDPAVYYGSREADLAMTKLFGGFDPHFYNAYKEAYPLEPDYENRFQIYKLYHLINHLNLFGRSYDGSVRSILERFS